MFVFALLAVGLLPAFQPITAEASSYSAAIQADSPAVYYSIHNRPSS